MTNSEPIGKQLKAARDAQSLAVYDVEAILKIKAPVIEMLENDLYPSQNIDVFIKGQLISYCKLLNINSQTIINCLESKGYDFPLGEKKEAPTQTAKPKRRIPVVTLSFLVALILYFSFTGSQEQAPHQPLFTQPLKIEQHYDN